MVSTLLEKLMPLQSDILKDVVRHLQQLVIVSLNSIMLPKGRYGAPGPALT